MCPIALPLADIFLAQRALNPPPLPPRFPSHNTNKVLRAYTPPKRVCDTCVNKFWAPKPQKPTSTATAAPASIVKPSGERIPLTISSDDGECPTDAERTAPLSPGTPAGFFMSPNHRNSNLTSDQAKQTTRHFRQKSKAVLDLAALVAPAASPAITMLSPPTPAGDDGANMVGTPSSTRGLGAFFGSSDNGSGGVVEDATAGAKCGETTVTAEAIEEEQEEVDCCTVDGRKGEGVVGGLAEKQGTEEEGMAAESSAVVFEDAAEHEKEEDAGGEIEPTAIVAQEEVGGGVGGIAEEVDEDDFVGLPLLVEDGEEASDETPFFEEPEEKQEEEQVDETDDVLLASWPAPLPAVPEEPAAEVEEEEEEEVGVEEVEELKADDKREGRMILPFFTGLGWSLVAVGTGLAIAVLIRLW